MPPPPTSLYAALRESALSAGIDYAAHLQTALIAHRTDGDYVCGHHRHAGVSLEALAIQRQHHQLTATCSSAAPSRRPTSNTATSAQPWSHW
eukprot:1871914-Prymnesium_polylepis.1